jgi:hypothetical protein
MSEDVNTIFTPGFSMSALMPAQVSDKGLLIGVISGIREYVL